MEQEGRPAPLQQVEVYPPPPDRKVFRLELQVCFPKPLFDESFAIVKPYVEELAKVSGGEYTAYEVGHAIMHGAAHLYMGFLVDPGTQTKTFVGYMIVRYEPRSIHIWQAYILPQYRNTNLLQLGADYFEEEVKKMGGAHISFSTTKEWGPTIEQMGFRQTFIIYRKDLTK